MFTTKFASCGREVLSEEEARALAEKIKEPERYENRFEIFFPIGHIEAAYAYFSEYTSEVKIVFKTPFKSAPVFLVGLDRIKRFTVSTTYAIVQYDGIMIQGHLPYVAIGLDVETAPAKYDIKEIEDKIEKIAAEMDIKAGLAGVGGALGGVILDRIISR